MTVAVSKAVEQGAAAVICASTGNTSASAAAYAARAPGFDARSSCRPEKSRAENCSRLLPMARKSSRSKATLTTRFSSFARLERAMTLRSSTPSIPIVSPDKKLRRSKSWTTWEMRRTSIFSRLGMPETSRRTGPVIASIERRKLHAAARHDRVPGGGRGADVSWPRVVENPETIASAIRIGNPASWEAAKQAVQDSRGAIDIVTDDEILAAQSWLATHEGIFVEPASAAPIAGLFKCCEPARNPVYSFAQIPEGSRIVCTVTGHGLKDPDVMSNRAEKLTAVPPNEQEVLRAIGFRFHLRHRASVSDASLGQFDWRFTAVMQRDRARSGFPPPYNIFLTATEHKRKPSRSVILRIHPGPALPCA